MSIKSDLPLRKPPAWLLPTLQVRSLIDLLALVNIAEADGDIDRDGWIMVLSMVREKINQIEAALPEATPGDVT